VVSACWNTNKEDNVEARRRGLYFGDREDLDADPEFFKVDISSLGNRDRELVLQVLIEGLRGVLNIDCHVDYA
jgi:hypothetical protein